MEVAPTQAHASRSTYLKVFAFLAVLTAVEVSVAFLIGTAWLRIAFLAVLAIAKAGLVVAFYMHLRFERIPPHSRGAAGVRAAPGAQPAALDPIAG
ncbi:MAG: hypothetical protein E6J26_11920 [Chloroflexi bacterium]|nr:MAG: hypothetical protein E6J26_11920 [Chloroflexota bacterium]